MGHVGQDLTQEDISEQPSGSSLGRETSRSAASPDPVRGWDEMASILLLFLPSQHKPVCASQPKRNMPFCLPRSRSKRVLPGGLVLPRHGSIHWGSTTGKTPQGWKKQKDETGSIQGGTWKMGIEALLLLVTPGESLLCIKPLRWEKKQSPCRQGALPSSHVHLKLVAEATAVKPFQQGGFPHPGQASP